MMLVRSSVPDSIDARLSYVPDRDPQDFLRFRVSCDGTCQEPIKQPQQNKNEDDGLCSPNLLSSSTEVHTSKASMPKFVYKRRTVQQNCVNGDAVLPPSRRFMPTFVYKRRKVQKAFPAQVSSDNGFSANSSDNGSLVAPDPLPNGPNRGRGPIVEEEPESETRKGLVNESCSSSKSNMDLDASECSSVTALKTLICHLCERSFRVSCLNPPMKKTPVGEWFCCSCSRKKVMKLKETRFVRSPKNDSGPIAAMLRDPHPYTTKVHIGKDFQAEVPDRSGPITDDLNDYEEPAEMSPSECASYQDMSSCKLSRVTSIGNWLQCRQVVDGGHGICGKWRRAPLFEVQTDDWECFRSVLWDPTHADCAVPQELDTSQVLKHLKYIEMLRPQLSAKRWKLGANKRVDPQEHAKNTQNS